MEIGAGVTCADRTIYSLLDDNGVHLFFLQCIGRKVEDFFREALFSDYYIIILSIFVNYYIFF